MLTNKRILLGFYQGLGDFVSAVPVMTELLKQDNTLYVAASQPCHQLFELLKIKAQKIEMLDYRLFASMRWRERWRFVRAIRAISPDYVFVSPHAEADQSSWKLPLLLFWLKRLGWSRTEIIGATSERNGSKFDQAVSVERGLKLVEREWGLHQAAGSIASDAQPELDIFDEQLLSARSGKPHLVIHPGASRENKRWPEEHWQALVEIIGKQTKVTFIGLETELEGIRRRVRSDQVRFYTGTITEAVKLMASASVCVTMDSGFSHIAARLGVKHLALFGSTSAERYAPESSGVWLMTETGLSCQPCHLKLCLWENNPCMSGISPDRVAEKVSQMMVAEEPKFTE